MTLKMLIDNGCIAIVEGANMPTTPKAKSLFQNKNLLFAPDKAANAGGGRCIGPGNATKRIAAKLELLRSRPTASNHYGHHQRRLPTLHGKIQTPQRLRFQSECRRFPTSRRRRPLLRCNLSPSALYL